MARRIMRERVRRFLTQVGRGWHLFQGAYLRGADLRQARLDNVTLAGADLRRARLTGASLQGAQLEGAHLEGADLRDANMRGADLRDANMRGALLDGVNMRGAWVNDDTLALLEDASDTHSTGVIVSIRSIADSETPASGERLSE